MEHRRNEHKKKGRRFISKPPTYLLSRTTLLQIKEAKVGHRLKRQPATQRRTVGHGWHRDTETKTDFLEWIKRVSQRKVGQGRGYIERNKYIEIYVWKGIGGAPLYNAHREVLVRGEKCYDAMWTGHKHSTSSEEPETWVWLFCVCGWLEQVAAIRSPCTRRTGNSHASPQALVQHTAIHVQMRHKQMTAAPPNDRESWGTEEDPPDITDCRRSGVASLNLVLRPLACFSR